MNCDVTEVRAKNGKKSILFEELLNKYNSNVTLALIHYNTFKDRKGSDPNGELTIDEFNTIIKKRLETTFGNDSKQNLNRIIKEFEAMTGIKLRVKTSNIRAEEYMSELHDILTKEYNFINDKKVKTPSDVERLNTYLNLLKTAHEFYKNESESYDLPEIEETIKNIEKITNDLNKKMFVRDLEKGDAIVQKVTEFIENPNKQVNISSGFNRFLKDVLDLGSIDNIIAKVLSLKKYKEEQKINLLTMKMREDMKDIDLELFDKFGLKVAPKTREFIGAYQSIIHDIRSITTFERNDELRKKEKGLFKILPSDFKISRSVVDYIIKDIKTIQSNTDSELLLARTDKLLKRLESLENKEVYILSEIMGEKYDGLLFSKLVRYLPTRPSDLYNAINDEKPSDLLKLMLDIHDVLYAANPKEYAFKGISYYDIPNKSKKQISIKEELYSFQDRIKDREFTIIPGFKEEIEDPVESFIRLYKEYESLKSKEYMKGMYDYAINVIGQSKSEDVRSLIKILEYNKDVHVYGKTKLDSKGASFKRKSSVSKEEYDRIKSEFITKLEEFNTKYKTNISKSENHVSQLVPESKEFEGFDKSGFFVEDLAKLVDSAKELQNSSDTVSVGSVFDYASNWLRRITLSFNVGSTINDLVFGLFSNHRGVLEGYYDRDQLREAYTILTKSKFDPKLKEKIDKLSNILNFSTYTSDVEYISKLDDELYRLQSFSGGTNVQSLAIAYSLANSIEIRGIPIRLWDALDLEDLMAEIDPTNDTDKVSNQLAKHSTRINNISIKLHGNYDPRAPVFLKSTWIGRSALVFKGFLGSALYERFSPTVYDDILDKFHEGRYVTLYNVLKKSLRDSEVSSNITKPILLSFLNSKEYHSVLKELPPDQELIIRNMAKTVHEFIMIVASTSIAILLSRIIEAAKPEDDEDEETYIDNLSSGDIFGLQMLLNQLLRIDRDLQSLISPSEFLQMVQNPFAQLVLIKNIIKFIYSSMNIVLGQEGLGLTDYSDENNTIYGSKLLNNASKLLPGVSSASNLYKSGDIIFDRRL